MGKIHEIARNAPNANAVMRLIETGTSINEQDNLGNTALHYAARHGNYVVAEALVNANADLEVSEKKGQTPLYHAVVGQHGDIVQLLLDAGVNPSHRTSAGYTPLHYSARNGLTGILKQLLQAGAAQTATTTEGHTPLALARDAKQKDAVAILEAFDSTGRVEPPSTTAVVDADEAALMAELDAIEVKPTPISAGPLIKDKKRVAPKSEDTPDGFGKVYLGKAPPPHMMKHMTGGRKMAFDPSTAPAPAASSTTSPPPKAASAPTTATKPSGGGGSNQSRSPPRRMPPPSGAPPQDDDDYTPPADATAMGGGAGGGGAVYSKAPAPAAMGASRSMHTGAKPLGGAGGAGGSPAWVDNLPSVVEASRKKPVPGGKVVDAGYAEPSDRLSPQGAGAGGDGGGGEGGEGAAMAAFIQSLGLPESCTTLAAEAGIDTPEDFTLFSESELVKNHGFKVGHIRKIFKNFGK